MVRCDQPLNDKEPSELTVNCSSFKACIMKLLTTRPKAMVTVITSFIVIKQLVCYLLLTIIHVHTCSVCIEYSSNPDFYMVLLDVKTQ